MLARLLVAAALVAVATANQPWDPFKLCPDGASRSVYGLVHGASVGGFDFHVLHANSANLMGGTTVYKATQTLSGFWNHVTGELNAVIRSTSAFNAAVTGPIPASTLATVVSDSLKPCPAGTTWPWNVTVCGYLNVTVQTATPLRFDNIYFNGTLHDVNGYRANSFAAGHLTLWGSQGWNTVTRNWDALTNRMGADFRFGLDCGTSYSCPIKACVSNSDCSSYLGVLPTNLGITRTCGQNGQCELATTSNCDAVFNANPSLFNTLDFVRRAPSGDGCRVYDQCDEPIIPECPCLETAGFMYVPLPPGENSQTFSKSSSTSNCFKVGFC
jgi:hypothetical protein